MNWCADLFQSTQPKRAATGTDIFMANYQQISIHAAQEGCDLLASIKTHILTGFQSTQPKRAATIVNTAVGIVPFISIHAAQEGCDKIILENKFVPTVFQSTQPKRAATELAKIIKQNGCISIHAAQEGCDVRHPLYDWGVTDFNPRSPRGLRPATATQRTAQF